LAQILVIGAGLAGCTVAKQLADHGSSVILIEKSHHIGGKVINYGCKAIEQCQNCGVCLTGKLWQNVSDHPRIQIMFNTIIEDVTGKQGDFTVSIKRNDPDKSPEYLLLYNITYIAVCTGFENQPNNKSSHLHIEGTAGIITGSQIEEIMLNRTSTVLFEKTPENIAFIQCVGSRDQNENGLYCSRVCCSYSTRAAKVTQQYYPECKITFFYMELQNVESGNYYAGLQKLGIEFIECRPLKITGGNPVILEYDEPGKGIKTDSFDFIIFSEGIRAGTDNDRIAEILNLDQDKNGFLHNLNTDSGIYITGCVKSPMKIDETHSDAISTANKIILSF